MTTTYLLILLGCLVPLSKGLVTSKVPPMGYNSWYDLQGDLNETNLKETVDVLAKTFRSSGYVFFNLDDGWASDSRDKDTNRLVADPSRFTNGTLKTLADYAHSKNLKFGTYTDRGTQTCAGKPGAYGFETIDAETYASWGVDYLKEDSCHASTKHHVAFQEYGKMRDALDATGRAFFFSLCGWNDWYAPEGKDLGNAWRIGPDDTNWDGVLKNIDINANLSAYAGPGIGWNDPCLLLAEDETGVQRITEAQSRFQFSMWAVMASPLLISGDIRNMSSRNVETYTNRKVIAINQDSLGKQGTRIVGSDLSSKNTTNIWAKPLSDGFAAIAFLNVGPNATDVKCDADCLSSILPEQSKEKMVVCAYDLWNDTRETVALVYQLIAYQVPPNGGVTLFRLGPCVE